MTTKTKGVAQCSTHLTLLSLVERKVQIIVNLRILVVLLMVDSWRYNIVLYRKDAACVDVPCTLM